MRYSALGFLVSAVFFVLPAESKAQPRIRLRIEPVQVGFGQSAPLAEFKPGFWTPVYIAVTAGPEGTPKGELIVESVDSDEVPNRYTVSLPPLEPNQQETILAFTKPGSISSEITVRARIDDRIVATNNNHYPAVGLEQQLLLSVGSGLPGLRALLNPTAKAGEEETVVAHDNVPRRRSVLVDDVRSLPNRWFAYEAVDLLILATGNRDFVTALLNEREGRKEALAEWLRRGGRMIVSIGRNQDMVPNLEALQALLPVSVVGTVQVPSLRSVANKWSGHQYPPLEGVPPSAGAVRPPVVVAKLEPKPGRETETLLAEREDLPLIVRGSYGMGRVTVVALDLDQQSPFAKWPTAAQKDFWKRLLDETSPPLSAQTNNQRPGFNPYGNSQNYDLASELQMNLEDFEDVPVISFGWVALFILLYILVVGPLDYLFLKKVVKRLELTWITFPTVVITISVAAYFTAYWLKGNDQKINKVDLVDIDLRTQQVYGNTWFTIFSPRIQHYTIGLEPAVADWVPPAQAGPADASVVLSWMARPETSFGGTGRQSQGLFRRAYDYLPDANGLIGVPIQVWSTKSFAASWQASLDRTRPLVSANLQGSKEKAELSGKITSRLPVTLEDVVVYAGTGPDAKWYSLLPLVPNGEVSVANIKAEGNGATPMDQWLTTGLSQDTRNPRPQRSRYSPSASEPTITVLKRLLFHQFDRDGRRNNSLRYLDESWRLRHKNEVIVFGRVARAEGLGENVTSGGASPSRLWLGSLPAMGQTRPPVSGTLAQETYVRMIVPVRSADSP